MSSSVDTDIDSTHEEGTSSTMRRSEREKEIKTKLKEIIDLIQMPKRDDGECDWEKDKDENGCCRGIFFCIIPIVLIVLIVMAVGKHREEKIPEGVFSLNGWPSQCFQDVPISELLPADFSGQCDEQIQSLCGEEYNQLNTSIPSMLELQACISRKWFDFSPECQAALDHEQMRPLFPSSLEQRFLVKTSVEACTSSIIKVDDVQRDCERFVEHFDETNLCQVYEIALCLLHHTNKIEAKCRNSVDEFGLKLPLDYDPRTYLSQQRNVNKWFEFRHNKYAKSAGILGVVWLTLLCCCGCCCCSRGKQHRKGPFSKDKMKKFMESKNPKSEKFLATATPIV